MHTLLLEEPLLGGVLEDFVRHELLEDLPVVNLLLDSVIDDKSIDLDIPFLSNTQGAISCLEVNHGVPVGVENDNLVCRSQVDAQAACSSGQQEKVVVRASVEGLD